MIMQIFNHSDSFCKWEWDERRAQNGWESSSTSANGSEIWAATKVIESFFHSSSFFAACGKCSKNVLYLCGMLSWNSGRREIIWSFVCLLNHDCCVVVVCNRNLLISFGFDCDLIALPWRFFFTQLVHIIKLFWSYPERLCAECWTWRTWFLCSLENYNWEFDPVVMLSRVIYTQQRDEKWEEENKISASFQFPTRWFCDIFALYMWLCCACLPCCRTSRSRLFSVWTWTFLHNIIIFRISQADDSSLLFSPKNIKYKVSSSLGLAVVT